jgi:hypoxanthine phosphoribosyltransferase
VCQEAECYLLTYPCLNRPYTDIDSFLNGHIYKAGAKVNSLILANIKVLVVDDSIASGSAMIEVKESLKHLEDKFDLKYCYLCNSWKRKNG